MSIWKALLLFFLALLVAVTALTLAEISEAMTKHQSLPLTLPSSFPSGSVAQSGSGKVTGSPSPSPSASFIPTQMVPKNDGSTWVEFQVPVNFVPVDGYATALEKAKILSAGATVSKLMGSLCFRNWMTKRVLIQTNGQTAAQVVDNLQGLVGNVPVKMYYRRMGFLGTSAVAYREPPDTTINLNRAYFTTDMDDCEWGATLAHEGFGHALGGYTHDFNWSPSRSFSVPYSLGGADQAQGGDVFDMCCE